MNNENKNDSGRISFSALSISVESLTRSCLSFIREEIKVHGSFITKKFFFVMALFSIMSVFLVVLSFSVIDFFYRQYALQPYLSGFLISFILIALFVLVNSWSQALPKPSKALIERATDTQEIKQNFQRTKDEFQESVNELKDVTMITINPVGLAKKNPMAAAAGSFLAGLGLALYSRKSEEQ